MIAHERLEHDILGPLTEQRDGVLTANWLVHPANLDSAAFSRTTFRDADETYPPEDSPYAKFTLRL